ncbi:MAG: hypothetical protein H7222_02210 [Methylotenera sp.]|nr:hypothetical protein [Oligoflexia bacterium]
MTPHSTGPAWITGIMAVVIILFATFGLAHADTSALGHKRIDSPSGVVRDAFMTLKQKSSVLTHENFESTDYPARLEAASERLTKRLNGILLTHSESDLFMKTRSKVETRSIRFNNRDWSWTFLVYDVDVSAQDPMTKVKTPITTVKVVCQEVRNCVNELEKGLCGLALDN